MKRGIKSDYNSRCNSMLSVISALVVSYEVRQVAAPLRLVLGQQLDFHGPRVFDCAGMLAASPLHDAGVTRVHPRERVEKHVCVPQLKHDLGPGREVGEPLRSQAPIQSLGRIVAVGDGEGVGAPAIGGREEGGSADSPCRPGEEEEARPLVPSRRLNSRAIGVTPAERIKFPRKDFAIKIVRALFVAAPPRRCVP